MDWHQAKTQGRRHLQSTCPVEKGFQITSSVFPMTDGCYFLKNTEDDKKMYVAATSVVHSQVIVERSNDEVSSTKPLDKACLHDVAMQYFITRAKFGCTVG